MKKVFLLLLFLSAFSLYSQEEEILEEEILFDESTVFIITDFIFNIKGRTRPDALIYAGEFKKGEVIEGEANLEKYVREKTQMLINQRVLKDNAEVSYSINGQNPDGSCQVIITITVEDSWNIIALPYPYYNSNTGFELTIKARDYNFLGTMNPLRVDLGYHYDENKRSSFHLYIDSNTPFTAFGYTWNFDFDNYFSYRPQVEEPFYYQNITGISMELPFRRTTFTFGFQEAFNVNEENADRYQAAYGNFQTGLYMASKLYTIWKIPTGFSILDYGELTYTPEIAATFNHEIPQWPLANFRKGPFLSFSHSLGFEKIDWISNYRRGLSVWLSNSYNLDFFRLRNEMEPLSVSFSLNGTGHFIIRDFFAISTRLLYRHWFYHDPDYHDRAADVIRGIGDKSICADYMLSLNLDFPFRLFVFQPSAWFNKPKLAFFDFEFQMSPVMDFALYNDPYAKISFNPKNIAVGGGVEFIVFPAFMRNLYACLSFSWNIREMATARPFKLPSGSNREITFGLGHFY